MVLKNSAQNQKSKESNKTEAEQTRLLQKLEVVLSSEVAEEKYVNSIFIFTFFKCLSIS